MADDTARYYHTTLYSFGEAARTAILTRFNTEVKDITIQCYYDTANDTFCMSCPRGSRDGGDRGPNADETLARIIDDYVEQQQSTGGNGEPPNVVRFPESNFDALDTFYDDKPAHLTASAQQRTPSATLRTHIIVVSEREGKLVKLFPIYDLHTFGLLERALAPRNRESEKAFSRGLTCRAAVWHPTNGHVFNGRTGKDKKLLCSGEGEDDVQLPQFPKLFDDREGADQALHDVPVNTWEFDGRPTTVQQWLNGMGDIVPVEPGARPDLPKDAKKLIAKEQTHATGRARVPKGAKIVLGDTEEDMEDMDSDEDSDETDTGGGFAAILAGVAPPRKSESGSDGDDSDDSDGTQVASFQALLPPDKDGKPRAPSKKPIMGSWTPDTAMQSNALTVRPRVASKDESETSSLQLASVASTKPRRPLDQAPSQSLDNEGWAEYGKKYANVDTIGIYGNASNTAKWHHEHSDTFQSPRKSKLKGVPVMARLPSSATSSRVPSGANLDDIFSPQSSVAPSVSDVPSTRATRQTIRNYSEWDPHEADWVNKPGAATQNTRSRLIDDSAPISTRAAQAPPGLLAPPAPEMPEHRPVVEVHGDRNLIDYEINAMDDQFPSLPNAKLPSRPQIALQRVLGEATVHSGLDGALGEATENDLPIPRIQKMPKNFATKFSTMHKAGRKMNGKSQSKSTGKKFTAQLELPEPAPVPKPTKKEEEKTRRKEVKASDSIQIESHLQGLESAEERQFHLSSSRRITKENHPFGQAIQNEISKESSSEADSSASSSQTKLICQFGLFLVRSEETFWSKLSHRCHDPLDLQACFRENTQHLRTDFMPRLTASTTDAKHLVALAAGMSLKECTTDCSYEIYIRDTASTVLKVTMPNAEKTNVTVTTQDQIIAEAAAHFAVHVWDARFSLAQSGVCSESSSLDAVKDFIASLATDQEAPSFRAEVPFGLFSVLRVIAKRSFSQVVDGLIYKVTEIHDLVCENVQTHRHNFRALSLTRDDMVAEQRLWWEASLETMDLDKAGLLQATVNTMVPEMDVVGLGNQGPYVYREDYKDDDDKTEVPEIPFW